MTCNITIFRVVATHERGPVTAGQTMGWGCQFPCGQCYIDWNRKVFPPERRLDFPHVSIYGSMDDVEEGTGGNIAIIDKIEAK